MTRTTVSAVVRRPAAFTLIELLVVISIIGLLIGILLPALSAARTMARSSQSLSNLRQIGIAMANYNAERDGAFPVHSSEGPNIEGTKPRWADYLFAYLGESPEVYRSPNLDAREEADFLKVFWHEVSNTPAERAARTGSATPRADIKPESERAVHGGYGYNFQYLGNARQALGVGFNARDVDIIAPSSTVTVGDVAGSRKGSASSEPGAGGAAVYSIDPPLGSARGSGKGSYYEGGSDENTGAYDPSYNYLYRSFPAERNNGNANISFADGHAKAMKRAEVDDFDGDGYADNGYWNGKGDASVY